MTNAPSIRTPLPGPRATAIIERDRAVVSPSYTRGYPLVIERGGRDRRGRGRQRVSRLLGRHRRQRHRPLASGRRRRHHETGRAFLHMSGTDFYYEVQVRLAEELAAVVPIAGGVKSFFGNSGTEAVEACLKLARYATGRPGLIAFLGGFHGRTMGSAGADGEQGRAAPRLRADDARRVSRAVRRLLPLSRRPHAGQLRGRVPGLHRSSALRAAGVARRSGRGRRRADSGRGRLCRGAGSVPSAAARADEEARHPAGRRRSAVRHGTHRQDVRDRVQRRRAGRRRDRQGHRVGDAAGRGVGARRA